MLSAKRIEPGQSGRIEASVKTEGVQGKLAKTVTVTSNDPRQPQIILNITALVEPEFQLSDRSLYFGVVSKGTEVVKELTVTVPEGRKVKVVGVESTDQYVSVQLQPAPGTGDRTYKILARQTPDAKEGYHFGNLLIKTTSSLTPELKVPMRGMISAGQGR